jgi:hypothetical protein
MSVPKYTYYAIFGAVVPVETQVYPSGDWSLKITKAEEDFPFCKDYRIKFDGSFIFSGDDYDLIMASDCCDKMDLKIKCDGEDYWFGYFAYPYDFEVDENRCQITGTPKPLDKYYYFDMYADYKREISLSDEASYQNNFDSAHANDPPLDEWPLAPNACFDCEPIRDIIVTWGSASPLFPVGFVNNPKSAFFNDSADGFPSGAYPAGAGNNYVTGFTNKLDNVVMAMANEVCNVGTTTVDRPEWSWNDLMEVLHNTFNTWWYIDENGDVRVEHIYFWELYFGTSYDLTTIDTGRWIVNSSKYDYTVEEMPKEEVWNWSEHWNDFDPENITYYGCYLPGKTRYVKEYSLSNLTNDIEYVAPGTSNLATSPTACSVIPSSDYMFLRCITRAAAVALGYGTKFGYPVPACADYVVWWSRYVVDGNDHLNAHLSPANLLVNYWMHDRPLWTGYISEIGDVAFESTWKTFRQMELMFPVCCDSEAEVILSGNVGADPRFLYQFGIEFLETITTQYGDGELYTGSIIDGMLSLQLIFEDLDCEETATEWSQASEL